MLFMWQHITQHHTTPHHTANSIEYETHTTPHHTTSHHTDNRTCNASTSNSKHPTQLDINFNFRLLLIISIQHKTRDTSHATTTLFQALSFVFHLVSYQILKEKKKKRYGCELWYSSSAHLVSQGVKCRSLRKLSFPDKILETGKL